MIFHQRLIIVAGWFVIFKRTIAYKTGCVDIYCFTASQPGTEVLSWTSANDWCLRNGTRLAEITTQDIQNSMNSFLRSISSEYNYNSWNVFTSGQRKSGSWTRVTGIGIDSINIRGYIDETYAYAYMQPTSSEVAVSASRPTDSKQGYICEGESGCSTSGGFVVQSYCYKSYSTSLSWYDARNRCLEGGGDLASFNFATNNRGLNALNGSWLNPSISYWIGFRRELWIWQGSNSEAKYTQWSIGHPIKFLNEPLDCLCVSPNNEWKWVECRCGDALPFLCLSEPKTTITTTTTSTTTTASTTTPTTTTTTASTSKIPKGDSVSSFVDAITSSNSVTDGAMSRKYEDKSGPAIGIGVGVGCGVVVVAIAVVVAVVLGRKRCKQRSDFETKNKSQNQLQPPDVIALQSQRSSVENPYGTVIRLPEYDEATSGDGEVVGKSETVYADLEILTKSPTDDADEANGANERSRPSSPFSATEGDNDGSDGVQYTTLA